MRGLCVVLVLAGTVEARCFSNRVVVRRVAAVQQVVQPVVPVAFVIASPSTFYGAPQYSTPAQAARREAPSPSPQASKTDSLLERIVTGMENLEKRMDALEARMGPPEPEPAVPIVVHNQCAKCHTGSDAQSDFELSDLSDPKVAGLAHQMVDDGKMPLDMNKKPVQLDPVTRKELLAALEGMRR